MKLKQMERNDCFKQEDLKQHSMTPAKIWKDLLGPQTKSLQSSSSWLLIGRLVIVDQRLIHLNLNSSVWLLAQKDPSYADFWSSFNEWDALFHQLRLGSL